MVRPAYADFTAWDPDSEHPDMKSTPQNPRWFMVDIQFRKKFKHLLALDVLKPHPELADMLLLRKGNRLSVLPLRAEEWAFILKLVEG